ncbi:hypothetical protein ACLB0R_08025 [Sphingomonas sp. GlSt437]|uniref:hypothetical protein n=1 Tax=Sphingomonas sp. GlSt437 TaxID=3389970 RepID=UPI003A8AA7FA
MDLSAQSKPQIGRANGAFAVLVPLGVLFWALGVVLLRALTAAGWLAGDGWHWLAYALIVLLTVPAVRLGRRAARLPIDRTLYAVTVMSMTALFIDGIVIGFAPWIYATDPAQARAAAGALLWGVAVALALGMAMERRAQRRSACQPRGNVA